MFACLLPHFLPWRWFSWGSIEVRPGVSRDRPLPQGELPSRTENTAGALVTAPREDPLKSQGRARKSMARHARLWHVPLSPSFPLLIWSSTLTLSTQSHDQALWDFFEGSAYCNMNLLSLGENEYLRKETLKNIMFHNRWFWDERENFDLYVPWRRDLQTFMLMYPLKEFWVYVTF